MGSAVVASDYDQKTASILKKYGPGPRVHFHIGHFEGHPNTLGPPIPSHAGPG